MLLDRTSMSPLNNSSKERPTIGFLITDLSLPYASQLWRGMLGEAKRQNANLLTVTNRGQRAAGRFDPNRGTLYQLVGPENVDGLVVFAEALKSSPRSRQQLQEFLATYDPLPIVCIGCVDGFPSLSVDNARGVHQMVDHLIEAHGYRKLAFLRGPEGDIEAEARLAAYQEALSQHEIPFRAELITPPRSWSLEDGIAATRDLLDRREAMFEAIVAANDQLATGAIRALRQRDIQVPYETAVVGFDDTGSARFVIPPLTTIRQPTEKLGAEAMACALRLIAGERPGDHNFLLPELVVRQSCGCLSRGVATAHVSVREQGEPCTDGKSDVGTLISDDVMSELSSSPEDIPMPLGLLEELIDTFGEAISSETFQSFLRKLSVALQKTVRRGDDIGPWQELLSTLRRTALYRLSDNDRTRAVENALHQARVMLAESAQQAQRGHQFRREFYARELNQIGRKLSDSFDKVKLMDVLVERLPRISIPSCYIASYDDDEHPPEWLRLELAYTNETRLTARGRRFPARHLCPPKYLPSERQFAMVIEPLRFIEGPIGFLMFEVGPEQGSVYSTLADQFTSALKGVILLRDHREAANTLRKERDFAKNLVKTAPMIVLVLDNDGRILRLNPYLEALSGYTLEKVEGEDWIETLIDPDERQRARDLFSEGLDGSGEEGRVIRLKTQEGITRDVEWFCTPLPNYQGSSPTLMIGQDVTEWLATEASLKRREDKLGVVYEIGREIGAVLSAASLLQRASRLIQERFDYHQVTIFTLDEEKEQLVIRASAGATTERSSDDRSVELGEGLVGWVGYERDTALVNEVDEDPRTGDLDGDQMTAKSELCVPIERGERLLGVLDVQSPHPNAFDDSDVLIIETLVGQIAVALENARLYRSLQRELSERRHAEELLAERAEELMRRNAELQRLTYIGSHHLREPVRQIVSYSQLLQERYAHELDDDADEFIHYIVGGAKRMQSLIQDLLAYLRVRAKGASVRRLEADLALDGALASLQDKIEALGASIDRDDLPEIVADPDQMEQLFQNLIDNALKFHADRPIEIHVRVEPRDREWLFSISDNGIGVEERYFDRVFGIFQQLHPPDVYSGTGIGLAICREIVEHHRGQIWIESTPGKGSTFFFTIPRHSESDI